MRFYFGQDNCVVDNDVLIKFDLSVTDVRYLKVENKVVYDFVGYIINPITNETLIVFPKHFYSDDELLELNKGNTVFEEDISLLFKVINKYYFEKLNVIKTDKYFGYDNEFDSDYPFSSFFGIYDYYLKYGIFHRDDLIIVEGLSGKLSWKKIIQSSNVIISDSNLVFLPLYSQQRDLKEDFMSECMVYVINHTIKSFSFLFNLPLIPTQFRGVNLVANIDYTLSKLYTYKSRIFKDKDKRLHNYLIQFFEEIREKKHGGMIHLKLKFFNIVWERMINNYLNKSFECVDKQNGYVIFNDNLTKSLVEFSKKELIIDDSLNNYRIIIDHHAETDFEQFIFDSKYYNSLDELNYKQLVYDFIVRASSNKETYDALFLPGKKNPKLHVDINDRFRENKGKKNKIIEQYFDVKRIMLKYINE